MGIQTVTTKRKIKQAFGLLTEGKRPLEGMKTKWLATLACVVFLSAPQSEASVLLSAEDFTILGGTAITSTGTVGTVISNGNVGLWPGATTGITGFPPAVIQNGAIIATGPVTDQAQQDLIKLKNGLAGMEEDVILSNQDLGGMSLTSGVYFFDGFATLNGNLVLDGEGLDDAYWVFQISTSITTSLNSTVSVINPGPAGGSDYGVFWNAGTEVIIGANNTLLGNYLSGTSITFGAQASGGARALAYAGVTLDQTAINARGGPAGSDWSGGLRYDPLGNIIPIPEPSVVLLLSLGLLGLLYRRRHCLAQHQK